MGATYDAHEAVINLVVEATGFPADSKRHGTWSPPYTIVNFAGGPAPLGDFGSRRSNATLRFSLRFVSESHRQIVWMKDRVEEALLMPDALGIDEQWVQLEVQGAIVPDGETLYSGTDNYLVRK